MVNVCKAHEDDMWSEEFSYVESSSVFTSPHLISSSHEGEEKSFSIFLSLDERQKKKERNEIFNVCSPIFGARFAAGSNETSSRVWQHREASFPEENFVYFYFAPLLCKKNSLDWRISLMLSGRVECEGPERRCCWRNRYIHIIVIWI